ncbi:MAG: monovalent cation/H(+) antiporter subunit G [Gammaproteobacteria bacterium]|nr:monovalent cation/H(+) antiporter subunit G [Gammaproteobacteria bacterium]
MSDIELPLWAVIPATLLLVLGGLLTLIGSLGLLRLRDFYARMHPPTMGTTLGAGSVLLASMITSSALLARPVIHEILITVFVVLSAPVAAMLLMRAAVVRRHPRREVRDAAGGSPEPGGR